MGGNQAQRGRGHPQREGPGRLVRLMWPLHLQGDFESLLEACGAPLTHVVRHVFYDRLSPRLHFKGLMLVAVLLHPGQQDGLDSSVQPDTSVLASAPGTPPTWLSAQCLVANPL